MICCLNQPSGWVGIGPGQEADEVEAQHLLHQLVIERLAAAVLDPAEHLVGAPAPGGRRAEQREGLVLAVPIGGDAMAAIERAGKHRVLHLERLGDRARGQQLELQAAAGHLVDAVDEVLREFVEDVLGGPGALELEHHRLLGADDIGHGERGGTCCRRCCTGLQKGAARGSLSRLGVFRHELSSHVVQPFFGWFWFSRHPQDDRPDQAKIGMNWQSGQR